MCLDVVQRGLITAVPGNGAVSNRISNIVTFTLVFRTPSFTPVIARHKTFRVL